MYSRNVIYEEKLWRILISEIKGIVYIISLDCWEQYFIAAKLPAVTTVRSLFQIPFEHRGEFAVNREGLLRYGSSLDATLRFARMFFASGALISSGNDRSGNPCSTGSLFLRAGDRTYAWRIAIRIRFTQFLTSSTLFSCTIDKH